LIKLYRGDCLKVLKRLPPGTVDCFVTDPPYGLLFMGRSWDHGVPGEPYWREALRVAKPGAHLLAFGGTRTFHRLAVAIEDAGWVIRDTIMWVYGSGMPKGRACLKPAWEPIIVARKSGKGLLNIDDCRIETDWENDPSKRGIGYGFTKKGWSRNGTLSSGMGPRTVYDTTAGRWPANLIRDGSEEVLAGFPQTHSGHWPGRRNGTKFKSCYGAFAGTRQETERCASSGSASRFFYCAKASRSERGAGNTHPTVKPLALMEYLVRLVSSEGQTVCDPFVGSGTTGLACRNLGRQFIGIDSDPASLRIARRRIAAAGRSPDSFVLDPCLIRG
jgi:DNA modification methylase